MSKRFVIHKHYATRIHYDLRVEKGQKLADWAVPKGIPLSPGKKVLAIKMPDHDKKWLTFEGFYEGDKGNDYGKGKMEIWDKGSYESIRWGNDTIVLNLKGNKVKGVYVLVKTKDNNWLLFKSKKSAKEYLEEMAIQYMKFKIDRLKEAYGNGRVFKRMVMKYISALNKYIGGE